MFCERIKKITEALYRVTDLLPDKEPLKWKLRNDAIDILDSLIYAESKDFFDSEVVFYSLRKINHFLQLISSASTFVSSINFEILRREYFSLNEAVKEKVESRKNELESFSINGILPASILESNGQSSSDKEISNGQKINNGQNLEKEQRQEKALDININTSIIPSEPLYDDAQNNKENDNQDKDDNGNGYPILLKERKRTIMSLIKNNEWLSIRDIATSMPGIGEKSIQRDLLEMVDAGTLKKMGDKRWRKYSLV